MSDIVNTDMAASWNGPEGADWVREAERFDKGLEPYNTHLLHAAAIGTRERVLDVGCGNGQSTRSAARAATDGSAHGVDLSGPMLDHARQKAAADGLTNVT